MSYVSKRTVGFSLVTFLFCVTLLVSPTFSLVLEETISRRLSIRSWTSTDIPYSLLLDVLVEAYGNHNGQRSVPRIGSALSLVLYPVNATGSYQFLPETNTLAVYDLSVTKASIPSAHYYDQSWVSDASVILIVVWNSSYMDNGFFASAEAGCLVQNMYMAAVVHDLGTCCVGSVDSGGLRNDLHLPSTMIPLLVMPLGYPVVPYSEASPDYARMTGNLPQVQYSSSSFEEAVWNLDITETWESENLSVQELSQLLWAAYGYTNTSHRTTPSSYGIYPLVVYVSNATGIYQHVPENHSVTKILDGDKRLDIATVFSGQVWAADAPTILLVSYDSAYNNGNTGDGGGLPHLYMEVNMGCVIQQLFLEASAWNLKANIVSEGLEEWNGPGAQELRNILGLSSSIIPFYAVPIGVPEGADRTPPSIVAPSQDPDSAAVDLSQAVTVSVEVTDEGVGVREVFLSYSIDEGQTWTDITMTNISENNYAGEIPGFEEEKHVQYRILAYDSDNNLAVEDNVGDFYIYIVIPEFSSFLIPHFLTTATLLTVIFHKRKRARAL